jgi:hypothetical protein
VEMGLQGQRVANDAEVLGDFLVLEAPA